MPIVPASEGARNTSVRGSQEYLQTRELRTDQQSKSKETKKNHQVIKSLEDIIESQRPRATPRETQIIRPIAIESSEDLSQGRRTIFFTRARQHRYENKIESRRDSTILFFQSSVPWTSLLNLRSLLFIKARREATRTKPPIFSKKTR